MKEAQIELARIIQDREMKDALLLVFANKQDLPGGEQHVRCSNLVTMLI
jgi:ADP-ribosylation factor protein 6